MFRYHVFMTLDWWIFKKFSQPAVNNFLNGTFQSNYVHTLGTRFWVQCWGRQEVGVVEQCLI